MAKEEPWLVKMKGHNKTGQVGSSHRETRESAFLYSPPSGDVIHLPLSLPSHHCFENTLYACEIIKPLPHFASLRADINPDSIIPGVRIFWTGLSSFQIVWLSESHAGNEFLIDSCEAEQKVLVRDKRAYLVLMTDLLWKKIQWTVITCMYFKLHCYFSRLFYNSYPCMTSYN